MPEDRRPPRWTPWLALAALLAARVLLVAVWPLDLAADEAYYWDWSRQLDWCYYSKPPLVAWLIGASTALLGPTEFAVKLPAALLATAAAGFVFAAAAAVFGRRAGWWAAGLFAATPAFGALGVMMTIDAPLFAFWAGALWAALKALDPAVRRPLAWWALAGLFAGLAALSKQVAWALPALAALGLVLGPGGWRFLRGGWWLLAGGVGLALVPVLWWNFRHGFITATHTAEHFTRAAPGWQDRLQDAAEFYLSQWGLGGLVTFTLGTVLAVWLGPSLFRLGARERFLFAVGPAPIFGVVLLALVRNLQPNWAGPLYLGGIILLGGWCAGALRAGPPQPPGWLAGLWARVEPWLTGFGVAGKVPAEPPAVFWRRTALWVGGALLALTLVLPWLRTPLTSRVEGWAELGRAVAELPGARDPSVILLFGTHRQPVSAVAFYHPDRPRVFRWNRAGVIDSQHELWAGPVDRLGQDALVFLDPQVQEAPPELLAAFARVERGGEVTVPLSWRREHRYSWWRARGFRDWAPLAPPLPGAGTHRPED